MRSSDLEQEEDACCKSMQGSVLDRSIVKPEQIGMTHGPMKIRPLSSTLTYLLAANAPVWLAAHIFGLQLRGYFNIEFAAIGILVVALSPLAISILLLGATALDIVSSISWTYMLPTL